MPVPALVVRYLLWRCGLGFVHVTAKAVGMVLPKVGTAKMLMLNFPRSGWDSESGCLLKYVICVKKNF